MVDQVFLSAAILPTLRALGGALTGVQRVVPLEPEAHRALIAPQDSGGPALHKACWYLARCHGLCVQLSPCSRSRCSTEGGGGGHLLDGLWQEVKFLKQLEVPGRRLWPLGRLLLIEAATSMLLLQVLLQPDGLLWSVLGAGPLEPGSAQLWNLSCGRGTWGGICSSPWMPCSSSSTESTQELLLLWSMHSGLRSHTTARIF